MKFGNLLRNSGRPVFGLEERYRMVQKTLDGWSEGTDTS